MSEKDKDFEAIYQGAIYAVFYEGREIKFRIGELNAEIDLLLDQHDAGRYAFLTAYNPRSTGLPEEENQRKQADLKHDLNMAGIKFLEGYGGSEDGLWQPEPSLFLFGTSEETAVSIARKYEQHAIVYGERGSAPRLVWCA